MKNIFLALSLLITISAFAQKVIRNTDGSYYKQCKSFTISKPLRSASSVKSENKEPQEAHDAARKFQRKKLNNIPFTSDPIQQTQQGNKSMQAPIQNFDGQTSTDGYFPLDPTGAVGPNHYVQAVNSNCRVYDKSGNAVTGVIDLASIFPNSSDQGDPIVMYDKFADRWIITEFETSSPPNGTCNQLLIAVSTSPDPTSTYYTYVFEPDSADFADYPKYSIWPDGYYETCNCDNSKVTVYDRTKMLTGDSTAGFIVIPTASSPSGFFWCPQTLTADGNLPPYGSPQYLMYFTDDNWGNGAQDKLMIHKVMVNWNNHTGSIALDTALTPQPFNSYLTGGTMSDISQPGTTNKIDGLEGFPAYRLPYIRWNGYNSTVMCHAVNVGNSNALRAGIRWYELRQDTTTNAWSIFQQGTYAPNDGLHRWNPSIAMDMNGSIGLAYSVADSASVYPGLRFTGRASCDAPGLMSLTESIAVGGLSSQQSPVNRWGDYSQTTIDPADGGLTFWHTNMYMGASNTLKTRIFSFQVSPSCLNTGITNNSTSNSAKLTAFQTGNLLLVKLSNIPSNGTFEVALYTVEGKQVVSKTDYCLNHNLETSLNISELAKGIYYVKAANNSFQRGLKIVIQ